MTIKIPNSMVAGVSRTLAGAVSVVTSPYSGTQQVRDWGGSWWDYDILFTASKGDEARALIAMLSSLNGPSTPFLLDDPTAANPNAPTTVKVFGGNQTGSVLVTSGWAASSLAIKAGYMLSIGTGVSTRLYMVTSTANADADGKVSLNISPPLRISPSDNQAIELKAPCVALRLKSFPPISISMPDVFNLSIDAREAL